MTVHFFDVETAPLPAEVILPFSPEVEAPANYSDPVKIAKYVIAAKDKWLSNAALSPVTGSVLIVGALVGEEMKTWHGEEKTFLSDFWAYCSQAVLRGDVLCGFCIKRFDLPFLVKRSWACGVKVPMQLIKPNRYWADAILDLQEVWQLGDRQVGGSLDTVSKFLGGWGKNGSGKDFAATWESDRSKALEYLKNDLMLCKYLYERMGYGLHLS